MVYRALHFITLTIVTILPSIHAQDYGSKDASILNEMLTQINALRAKNYKGEMHLDDQLIRAAQLHTEDQARNGIMTHDGNELDSKLSMGDRIKKEGFQFSSCAENVAAGQTSVSSVMESWINSPGHLHNLLGDYDCVGIGHATSTNGPYKDYWTQDFGTRMNGECVYTGGNSSPTEAPPTASPTPIVTVAPPVQTSSPPATTVPTPPSSPPTTMAPEVTPSPQVYPTTPQVSGTKSPFNPNGGYDFIWKWMRKHWGEYKSELDQLDPTQSEPDQSGPDYPSLESGVIDQVSGNEDDVSQSGDVDTAPPTLNPEQTDIKPDTDGEATDTLPPTEPPQTDGNTIEQSPSPSVEVPSVSCKGKL